MRALMLLLLLGIAAPAVAETRGEQWWHHVQVLAADDMRGRQTGSADYLRAADYVIDRFKALGLQPAGTEGFFQPIAFTEQAIDSVASQVALVGPDGRTTLAVPGDIILSGGGGPAPEHVSAGLVFAGYGLRIPEAGYDDFAGLDLKGKVVVVIAGGPANISGALKSDARADRSRFLSQAGALGIIQLTPPKQIEIPWPRRMLLASLPAMYLSDDALRDVKRPFLSSMMDTAKSERLFAASGHSFAEVAALADASQPVPTFALPLQIEANVVAKRRALSSPNILAKLPGSDPKLASEYVMVSAHLDHLGVGQPIAGDPIYNGAMDNASGVANVLEIAAKLRADGSKPRRSILFAVVTAEEKGLLGARYLAKRPPVRIVADLNFDMPLPLWPLKSVIVLGASESSIGADARAVGETRGLPLAPDPLPDRNSFTRSDQYSFIREGIPSVAFKFGFARDTPEFQIEHDWRANRYHAPSDDLAQPVEKEEAVKLNDYVAALALRLADADARPSWNGDSYFRRFAKP